VCCDLRAPVVMVLREPRCWPQSWVNGLSLIQTPQHSACFGRLNVGVAVPMLCKPLSSATEDDLSTSPTRVIAVFVLFWAADAMSVPVPEDCKQFLDRVASAAAVSFDAVNTNPGGPQASPPVRAVDAVSPSVVYHR
jgi:hypothetical protein